MVPEDRISVFFFVMAVLLAAGSLLFIAANLLTILATCKNAGENPYAYLLNVMQRMPLQRTTELGSLLPERWTTKTATPAAE